MSQIETILFRALSGEDFEADRYAVRDAANRFEVAKRRKRPVLLVLSDRFDTAKEKSDRVRSDSFGLTIRDIKARKLLNKFEIATIPKIQLAALTNLHEIKGWEELPTSQNSSWQNQDIFLVITPSGKILTRVDHLGTRPFSEHLTEALDLFEKEIEDRQL